MNVSGVSQPKALEVGAVVTRCGCTEAQKTAADWHARMGVVCPRPLAIEDLGRIAAWYRNPLRNVAWRLSQLIRGRRAGVVRAVGD